MKKILIIEDDPEISETLKYALEEEGYETAHAEDGGPGLDMARSFKPDIILLDILLPGMNGIEVCRSLKSDEKYKAIPIVMMTAMGEKKNIVEGFTSGADDYVSKPFYLPELLARINSHIKMKEFHENMEAKEKKGRMDAEEKNRASREMLETIMEAGMIPTCLFDMEGNITGCNTAYVDWSACGSTKADILGTNLLKGAGGNRFNDFFKKVLNGEKPCTVIDPPANAVNNKRTGIFHGVPLYNSKGELVGGMYTINDIAEYCGPRRRKGSDSTGSGENKINLFDGFFEKTGKFILQNPTLALGLVTTLFCLGVIFLGFIYVKKEEAAFKAEFQNEVRSIRSEIMLHIDTIDNAMRRIDLNIDYHITGMAKYLKNKGITFKLFIPEAEDDLKGLTTPQKTLAYLFSKPGNAVPQEVIDDIAVLAGEHEQGKYMEEKWKIHLPLGEYDKILAEVETNFKKNSYKPDGVKKNEAFFSKETDGTLRDITFRYRNRDKEAGCYVCHGYTPEGKPLIFEFETDLRSITSEHNTRKERVLRMVSALVLLLILGTLTGYFTFVRPVVTNLQESNLELKEASEKQLLSNKELERLLMEVDKYATEMEDLAEERSQQLIHADRMTSLGLLSAGVAHEINNPNTVIKTNAQVLQLYWPFIKDSIEKSMAEARDDQKKLASIKSEYLNITEGILESVKRTSKIINGLKDFAKQGTAESSFEKEDIETCLNDAIRFTSYIPVLKNGKVIVDIAPGLPLVFMNKGEIQQVLVNMFTNAAHAMEGNAKNKAPVLKISVAQKGGAIVLKVTDNGNGMDKEALSKIFKPFYTTKFDGQGSGGEGTGLGLSICHGIIEKHRGTIHAESTPNHGTTLTIVLPIDPYKKERRKGDRKIQGGMRQEDEKA